MTKRKPPKNRRIIKNYKKAYELRIEGKTFREIGEIMGISGERARTLNAYYYYRKHGRFYGK